LKRKWRRRCQVRSGLGNVLICARSSHHRELVPPGQDLDGTCLVRPAALSDPACHRQLDLHEGHNRWIDN
jgi:hypothetical protein